jgi:hypothetical protein
MIFFLANIAQISTLKKTLATNTTEKRGGFSSKIA